MATFINLTPHDVRLFVGGVCTRVWPASSTPARLILSFQNGVIDGVPITRTDCHGCDNLPDEVEDTYYIVSSLVQEYFPQRFDLLVPDTNWRSVVRDRYGDPVGNRSLRALRRRVELVRSETPCNIS